LCDGPHWRQFCLLVKTLLKVGDQELFIDCYRPELELVNGEVYYG